MKSNRGNRQGQRYNNRGSRNGPSNLGLSSGLSGASNGGGGSMRNEQLQLHELDLELALLRRKREIIEQQQTMLIGPKPFNQPSPFETPSLFSQQQFGQSSSFGQASNFSRFYDSGPEPFRQGIKRPASDSPWQSAPKRSGPSSNYRSKPTSGPSGPRRPAPANRTGFTGKVTKAKNRTGQKGSAPSAPQGGQSSGAAAAPAERPTKSAAEKQEQAASMGKAAPKAVEKLELDKPISRPVLGRLELALGTVLKELKTSFGEAAQHASLFAQPSHQRALKQAVRERIRTAMLGKVVGSAFEICAVYRQKYPKETDEQLLQQAHKAAVDIPFRVSLTADPQKYYKNNIDRLLGLSLEKIFAQMTEICNKDDVCNKTLNEIVDTAMIENNISDFETYKKEVEKEVEATKAQESTEASKEETKTEGEGETVQGESATTAAEENKEGSSNVDEVNTSGNEITANDSEMTDLTQNDSQATDAEAEKEHEPTAEWYQHKFYNRVFDALFKRRLPIVLPRYRDTLLRLMHQHPDFVKTQEVIRTEAMKLIGKEPPKEKPSYMATSAPAKGSEQSQEEKKTQGKWRYFVKVLGRPSLPKRKSMQAFLDQFHPKTIKKHRGIHNLLFVGFNDKADYDAILAASNTVVGNSTIEVRPSETKGNTTEDNNAEATATAPATSTAATGETSNETNEAEGAATQEEEDKDKTVCLDESLDNQITDLLCAIGEENENKEMQANQDNANQDNDNQDNANEDDANEDNANEETEAATNENEEMDTDAANEVQNGEAQKENATVAKEEKSEEKEPVKTPVKQPPPQPARVAASTPNAGTPTIRTRRASKLAKN